MTNTELHNHTHAQNRFAVIPTADKLQANSSFAGRGVNIAFLDSGFYPHPDIAERVIVFHDVTGSETGLSTGEPKGHHWHGTQTVVSCAGDGSLSDGVYRGLAFESKLVLVKVSDNGRIADKSIEKGLQWVIDNRERYDIRVLNMSLGGDADLPTAESTVNKLTSKLVAAGVVVTVAAGNSAEACSIPPASSPSVITVGGYSDENQFDRDSYDLYHSSHGETADGLVKPELIAPAMYVAAPILPETADYDAAETLSELVAAPDYRFRLLLGRLWQKAGLTADALALEDTDARRLVEDELTRRKVVATHYQHVDGTSFAAPITASVAAQMIEANPGLTPAAIKNILISTASRLGGRPHVRQGFGVLNASLAIEKAAAETHFSEQEHYFPPRIERGRILFCYHDDDAASVSLCGDFNDWDREATLFERNGDGLWHTQIACQPAGNYRYKFLIDGHRWTEDPSHALKQDDGLGGLNSLLSIA
jgi:serine protease AprX